MNESRKGAETVEACSPERSPAFAPEEVVILAIESSTARAGVALARGETVLVEFIAERPRIHSAWLLPAALQALKLADVVASEVSCLAVSEGPGSFTGLRVGCATVQGLAAAWSKPVALVPSFLVVAAGVSLAGWRGLVAVGTGLSRGTVTGAVYRTDGAGGVFEEVKPADRTPAALLEEAKGVLHQADERLRILCAGEAGAAIARESGKRGQASFILADPYLSLPRAGILARIGLRFFLEGRTVPPERAVPRYYRRPPPEDRLQP